jgi:hypothetical protein
MAQLQANIKRYEGTQHITYDQLSNDAKLGKTFIQVLEEIGAGAEGDPLL